MKKGIKAREITLERLFAPGEALRMPFYQRSYSWNEDDALALLDDFIEETDNNQTHFIGAIVLVESTDPGIFEIVDGQQRLTTLTILLAVLRDLEKNQARADAIHTLIGDEARPTLAEDARWRLTLNHSDMPFFRAQIQERGATQRQTKDTFDSDSQKRIIGNKHAFMEQLSTMSKEDRRQLTHTLVRGCEMVRVTVKDRSTGFKAFRVLNIRGRKPNAHDILKTDLFERASFTLDEAAKYSRNWVKHEAEIGGSAFDALLGHIRFLHDRSHKGTLVAGFHKVVHSKAQARTFLDELLPRYVKAYDQIMSGKVECGVHTKRVNDYLARLRALDHKNWRAPALKYLVERPNDEKGVVEFFHNLERLGYAVQLILHGQDKRRKRYRAVCEAVSSDRALFAKKGPFALSKDECKKIRERLRGRFGTFGQRRALALRLNAALEGGESLTPESDATVEHVLPRNPEPDSHWLVVWPNPQLRHELCDTIGNFVLLPHSINQEADRMIYQEKKKLYFDESKGKPFALTSDLEGIDSWTAPIVRERTERLADILAADWGIQDDKKR